MLLPDGKVGGWSWKVLTKSGLFDNDKKLADYSEKEMRDLLHGEPLKVDVGGGLNIKLMGLADEYSRKYIKRDLKTLSERTQKTIIPCITDGPCEVCHGARLSQQASAIVIDQSSVGVTSRSNPATYTGIFDVIRKRFATANNVDASLFSFNSKGGCENCQGSGYVATDLAFLASKNSYVRSAKEVATRKRSSAIHFKVKILQKCLE